LSAFFVDTSAFAKRYIVETGSAWMRSWILQRYRHDIFVSRLSVVEFSSVLARRVRQGLLAAAQVQRVQKNFNHHLRTQYEVVEIEFDILRAARTLLFRHPLRTLDAIQLASALHTQQLLKLPLTFITADKNLLTAASSEGFGTDDPNAHP
jgi:uncharacterized protein